MHPGQIIAKPRQIEVLEKSHGITTDCAEVVPERLEYLTPNEQRVYYTRIPTPLLR